MNIIEWLQEWTKSQIDGDWEHEQGVQIDMYDNPGWFIKVDISNYIDFVEEEVVVYFDVLHDDPTYVETLRNVYDLTGSSRVLEIINHFEHHHGPHGHH